MVWVGDCQIKLFSHRGINVVHKTLDSVQHAGLLRRLKSLVKYCFGQILVKYLALFFLFLVIGGFKWFWMGSLCKNIQLMLVFLKAPFLVSHFSYFTSMTLLVICNIAIFSGDTTFFS